MTYVITFDDINILRESTFKHDPFLNSILISILPTASSVATPLLSFLDLDLALRRTWTARPWTAAGCVSSTRGPPGLYSTPSKTRVISKKILI